MYVNTASPSAVHDHQTQLRALVRGRGPDLTWQVAAKELADDGIKLLPGDFLRAYQSVHGHLPGRQAASGVAVSQDPAHKGRALKHLPATPRCPRCDCKLASTKPCDLCSLCRKCCACPKPVGPATVAVNGKVVDVAKGFVAEPTDATPKAEPAFDGVHKLDWPVWKKLLESARLLSQPFTLTQLCLIAWQQFPLAFGLAGEEGRHPSDKKVQCAMYGVKGLLKRGYVEKVGDDQYRVVGGEK
jgi:hypothetical protein